MYQLQLVGEDDIMNETVMAVFPTANATVNLKINYSQRIKEMIIL